MDTADTGNPKRGTDKASELGTYSGKIEFASESLRQNTAGRPGAAGRAPLDSLLGGIQEREPYEKYPLQIILPHPRFSFHTHYDNNAPWLNEIPLHRVQKDGYHWWPVRINPEDAKARNVSTGDIVELYNDRGSGAVHRAGHRARCRRRDSQLCQFVPL